MKRRNFLDELFRGLEFAKAGPQTPEGTGVSESAFSGGPDFWKDGPGASLIGKSVAVKPSKENSAQDGGIRNEQA